MVDAEILDYYSRGLERDRLAAGRGRVEFMRMRELLARFLPPAPAAVLDVGGGAGAYAIPLAAAGYQVHLIDPVPLHVEQAAAASRDSGAPLASVSLGDARELRAADGSADAVLLLGPLYHLTGRADRVTALREAAGCCGRAGWSWPRRCPGSTRSSRSSRAGCRQSPAGVTACRSSWPTGSTATPAATRGRSRPRTSTVPRSSTAEIADAGLEVREFLAISGNVKLLPGLSERLDDAEGRAHVLSVLRLVEAEPSLIGLSQNFVAIAALPASDREAEPGL